MRTRLLHLCLIFGLFASVVGGRWALVSQYSTDLPEWDQWDAEGLHLLLPWYRGEPLLPALFNPHNEHYVVLTKLLSLTLTVLNGNWDQRLECVVNAILPALVACGFLIWSRTFVRSAVQPAVALFVATAWGLPFAWHNIISGFHSQQFFLIALSFAAIVFLPFAAPWSARWWLGTAAALLALLSMASGMFAGAAVLVVLTMRLLLRREPVATIWPSALVALTAMLIGWFTRHEVDYHLPLRAKSVSDFWATLVRSLQWPARGTPWFAVALWLPWIWTALHLTLRPKTAKADVQGWTLFGLGVWVSLQLLVTAYVRGAGGAHPAVRYLDTLVFGCCVNFFSILWLWHQRAPGARRWLLAICAGLWITLFGWSTYGVVRKSIGDDLARLKPYHRGTVIHTRAYLATGDRNHLIDPIPYPGVDAFLERINQPELSRLMPASVRPSMPLEPAADSASFELLNMGIAPDEESPPGFRESYPAFRRVWRSSATPLGSLSDWSSAPIRLPHHGGRLVFEIFGQTDGSKTALELRDASSNSLLATVQPFRTPNQRWEFAAVAIPQVPFVVHARKGPTEPILAFAEPVIMPTGSYVAWRLSERGGAIATVGFALLLLLVAGGVARGMSGKTRSNAHSA